jgi:hypothetical protein
MRNIYLKAQVQRSKSSLFSFRVKCQECMGTTYLCSGYMLVPKRALYQYWYGAAQYWYWYQYWYGPVPN